jgi:hypothetical protein
MTKETNQRTIVSVDNQSYKLELLNLEQSAIKLKRLKEICFQVNSENLLSMEQLETEILKDSNFKNVDKVAELKGIDYSFYKANINHINEDLFDSEYNIKEEVKSALKEKHTIYFDNEQEIVKRKLDKVCEILNSINQNYTTALYRNPETRNLETNILGVNQVYNLQKTNRI